MNTRITVHLDLSGLPPETASRIAVRARDGGIDIAIQVEPTSGLVPERPPTFTRAEVEAVRRHYQSHPRSRRGWGWPALLGALLLGWWLGS